MILEVNLADAKKKFGFTELQVMANLIDLSNGRNDFIINVKNDWEKFHFTATSHINRVLNKLEVLGIITKKSLGVKGTYIRIHNREALEFIVEGAIVC